MNRNGKVAGSLLFRGFTGTGQAPSILTTLVLHGIVTFQTARRREYRRNPSLKFMVATDARISPRAVPWKALRSFHTRLVAEAIAVAGHHAEEVAEATRNRGKIFRFPDDGSSACFPDRGVRWAYLLRLARYAPSVVSACPKTYGALAMASSSPRRPFRPRSLPRDVPGSRGHSAGELEIAEKIAARPSGAFFKDRRRTLNRPRCAGRDPSDAQLCLVAARRRTQTRMRHICNSRHARISNLAHRRATVACALRSRDVIQLYVSSFGVRRSHCE